MHLSAVTVSNDNRRLLCGPNSDLEAETSGDDQDNTTGSVDAVDFSPDLLLLNVQGLNPTKCSIIESDFLTGFGNLKFICLTETWMSQSSAQSCQMQGFHLASFYARSRHRHGGVAILAAEGVQAVDLDLAPFCIELDVEICGCNCDSDLLPFARR